MKFHRRAMLMALLVAALTSTCLPAAADRGHGGGSGHSDAPSNNGGGLSAQQAAAIVSRTYGGRVVSVKSEGGSGERVYRVRVLLDGGRIKTVQVDSRGHVSD